MSTVQEIEAAIRALHQEAKDQLMQDLPKLLPELKAEVAWARIVDDPRPRPSLTALGDAIEAKLKMDPDAFAEIHDHDFE